MAFYGAKPNADKIPGLAGNTPRATNSWPCPECIQLSMVVMQSRLRQNAKCPHGIWIPPRDQTIQTNPQQFPLSLRVPNPLRAEVARLGNILTEWQETYKKACDSIAMIHVVSNVIKDIKLGGEFNTYQPFPADKVVPPYRRPLIMIARLFWMYTVSVIQDSSSTQNLIARLSDVKIPTGDHYGKRQYDQKLDGSIVIESAERRAPSEYLALAQTFSQWYTSDTVQLDESERSAWSALQLAVLILWDLTYA